MRKWLGCEGMNCVPAAGLLMIGAVMVMYAMARDDAPIGRIGPHAASPQHWGSHGVGTSVVHLPPARKVSHTSNVTAPFHMITKAKFAEMVSKAENAEISRSRVAAARCAQLAEPSVHERTQNLTGRRGYCSVVVPGLTNGAWRSESSSDELVAPFDCARDNAGELVAPLAAHISGSFQDACAVACRSCAHCRYISISIPSWRCLWFARCDLNDLRPSRHGEQWTTWEVTSPSVGSTLAAGARRSMLASPQGNAHHDNAQEHSTHGAPSDEDGNGPSDALSEAQSYRVGLATLFVQKPMSGGPARGGPQRRQGDAVPAPQIDPSLAKWGCSLLGWCQSARRLREALPPRWTVDLLMLTTAATPSTLAQADCPEIVVTLVPPQLRRAARSCAYQLMGEGGMADRRADGSVRPNPLRSGGGDPHGVTLFKWALLSLHSYDAILFADLDVDLAPDWSRTFSIRQWWQRWMRVFVSHPSLRFISAPDHSAPFNMGTFLLAPRNTSAIYKDGLAVLRRCDFSDTDGWAAVGSLGSLRLPTPRSAARLAGRGGAGSAGAGGTIGGGTSAGGAGSATVLHTAPGADAGRGGDAAGGVDSGRGWGGNEAVHAFNSITCFPPPETASTGSNGILHTPRRPPAECSLADHPITRMRSWSFVFARSDQGFFFALLGLKHRVAAIATWRSPHRTIHWYGANKPWRRPKWWGWARRKPYAWLQGSYEYISRLDLRAPLTTGGDGVPSPCMRHLMAFRHDIEALDNFERPWNATAGAPVAGCKRFTVGQLLTPINYRPVF